MDVGFLTAEELTGVVEAAEAAFSQDVDPTGTYYRVQMVDTDDRVFVPVSRVTIDFHFVNYREGDVLFLIGGPWEGKPKGWECTVKKDYGTRVQVTCKDDGKGYCEPKTRIVSAILK